MIDAEKVKRGLEVCSCSDINMDCPKCPYHMHTKQAVYCMDRLMREALALLKEQEARVLSKEEAVHYMSDEEAYEFSEKAPLYVEHKTLDEWDFKWARAETVYTWMCDLRMRQNYGITFRLWTSRPTEEQRKAVKWDE